MKKNAKKIFKATISELLNNKSLEYIKIKEIVELSGLTQQSFYNNFRDKYDLVYQIFADDSENSLRSFSGRWDVTISNFLNIMQNKQRVYTNALKYKGQNSLTEGFSEYIIRTHSMYLLPSGPVSEVENDIYDMIRFHAYGTAMMTTEWALSGMKKNPEVISELFYQCMPNQIKSLYLNTHYLPTC